MPGRQEPARVTRRGGPPRADPGAPRAYPRSSSVAATSTARSSEPATSRARHRRAAHRRGRRAAQGRGLAEPRVVGGGKRHEAGDQRGGQRRAARQRAQQAQDAVRVDAGGVDREGHQDDEDPQCEHAALRQRLGAHVGVAQERQPEPVDDDRLAPLRDEPVDDHDEDAEAQPPAR